MFRDVEDWELFEGIYSRISIDEELGEELYGPACLFKEYCCSGGAGRGASTWGAVHFSRSASDCRTIHGQWIGAGISIIL